ncbi:MAG: bifunctional phosphopantothenoylcysteine decarboxylase/phosphopantothenate--cysteine ligase CoaBC [Pseudomonadota bacterium]|nr:bifunctional phosphopantothenoylcysteine decarboxylase/phosphopantothenate--cysteine ligase CoaBC [Pseudomonadota bacterium]QKK04529.1 MAG: bifunctional phosphopantothenoylcysteine decarboxylase/phosphopantothenate--cysteine ligase CoaBC [Pseudomonadota bacterium]
MTLAGKNILLIISGGIAAYKALELIRLIKKQQGDVRCILTKGGAEFVTPLSVAALSENQVYADLFSLKDESEMGHIRLSREADLIVVAPATAHMLAKMAQGFADDLAATVLLASDKPVMVAPAMNPQMWAHPATQDNIALLKKRGVLFVDPAAGEMACGETGEGRLAEPEDILKEISAQLAAQKGALSGKKALVTSGPTYEPLDPVRFLGNHSSGKQGIAIATALAKAGAETTLVTGPTHESIPAGINIVRVTTAAEMLAACEAALPCDITVCAAAVADWTPVNTAEQKMKKRDGAGPPAIELKENPDILKTLAGLGNKRPPLLIGFAAETGDVVSRATAKLAKKGCDWIVANDVSAGTETFGGDSNTVHLLKAGQEKNKKPQLDTPLVEQWPRMGKSAVAAKLVDHIIAALK